MVILISASYLTKHLDNEIKPYSIIWPEALLGNCEADICLSTKERAESDQNPEAHTADEMGTNTPRSVKFYGRMLAALKSSIRHK